MSRRRSPLWVFGAGPLTVRLATGAALALRVSVDGEEALARVVDGEAAVGVALDGARWHLVTLEVDRLLAAGPRQVGARLVGLELDGRKV